jgi:hypothetical protein
MTRGSFQASTVAGTLEVEFERKAYNEMQMVNGFANVLSSLLFLGKDTFCVSKSVYINLKPAHQMSSPPHVTLVPLLGPAHCPLATTSCCLTARSRGAAATTGGGACSGPSCSPVRALNTFQLPPESEAAPVAQPAACQGSERLWR